MNDIYPKLRLLLDKYNLFERLGDEDYGSLYVDIECLIAEQVKQAKIEAFDVAFDCHDYDRLRAYRAELENQ